MFRIALLCGMILPVPLRAADDKKEVPKEMVPFQGVWKLVKVESGGKGPPDGLQEEVRFTFVGNKLTIREGKAPPEEGTYAVDPKKEPGEIDLISTKNEKILGIFKFDKDDKLIVSHAIKSGGTRPKKFDEANAVMLVLEKTKETPSELKQTPKELVPFQGTWKVLKLEVGGKELPAGQQPVMQFTFKGDSLIIVEGKGNPQAGAFSVDSKKDPGEIDMHSPTNEKILGIYKFDKNGKLTISYIRKPNAMRPKKFDEADTVTFTLEKAKE
jgi:uncharacterized protein (TIGR03067 family)